MKTKTKRILWSLGIGALLAVASTYGLNAFLANVMDFGFVKGEGLKVFSIVFAEFISFTLLLGATIKSLFFD